MSRLIPDAVRPHRYFAALARKRSGLRVMAGPFQGMDYTSNSVGSAYVPKLLGIYERELAGTIEEVISAHPNLIVDVGAAEGYYAVGLACRLPDAKIIAFEAVASGQNHISAMAVRNGVRDRVSIMGRCEPEDLNRALANHVGAAVIMDVEGYERALLDLERVPALATATIIVEIHEFVVPGITEIISARLRKTHSTEQIWTETRSAKDFPWRTLVTRLLPRRYTEGTVSEMRPAGMSWFVARPL